MDTSENFENEEGQQATTINFKPSFVLIAIDTHSSMFETRKVEDEDDSKETHAFKDVLSACYEIADSLILSMTKSNYNQFGIVLADKDEKASLIEVEDNLLESVKLLKDISSKSNEELKLKYERKEDIDLASFFLLCKKKFKDINSAFYKRTLIYITNDDDPLKGEVQKKFTTLNEVKTFDGNDIALELVTMTEDFDYTKLYNELFHVYSKRPLIEEVCKDKDGLIEKLSASIVFRYTKLRYNFYPFENDHLRYLKVMKVNFIRKAKLYNERKASRDGRMLLKVKKDSSAKYQVPTQFKLLIRNSDPISLNLKDKHDIFGNDLPLGFHLQYVSNRQTDVGVVIDNVSLMLLDPKEELGEYFAQFWQYCVKNKKVLVCLKKYRHPCEIRYVELIPKYANNQKLFLIKDIPFCEEFRFPKVIRSAESTSIETTQEQKEAIKECIEHFSYDYSPKTFCNLSYQKKKAYVKSKLLNLPEEVVEDSLSMEGIDEHMREVTAKVKHVFSFGNFGIGDKKRKATSSAGKGRGKKLPK